MSLSLSQWYPGSMWHLIVSISDLCTLTYFYFIVLLRSIGICVLSFPSGAMDQSVVCDCCIFSSYSLFYGNISTVESGKLEVPRTRDFISSYQ